MSEFFGQLPFGFVRDLAEGQANSKLKGRARLIVGLVIGLAALSFFPVIGLLLSR